jgi:hypothetical protein
MKHQRNAASGPYSRKAFLKASGQPSTVIPFGAFQWADATYNIAIGCIHNCRYCYGKENHWYRFHRTDDWATEKLKPGLPQMPRNKRVMFPSCHDISPFYLAPAIEAIRCLLDRGNQVLVVSKPHLVCVRRLLAEFAAEKQRLLFRFTIGSFNRRLTDWWEPGAPPPAERLKCLQLAHRGGFQTSVSIEPMLDDIADAERTATTVLPWVTETIWIGRMNKVRTRVRPADAEAEAACDRICRVQSDEEMLRLVAALGHHTQIRWKESISRLLTPAQAGPQEDDFSAKPTPQTQLKLEL